MRNMRDGVLENSCAPAARQWSITAVLLSGLALLFSANAVAQNLDEFRTAAGGKGGVNLIPFSDLRSKAATLAGEVDRAKVESKYDHLLLERQKNNLLSEVERTNEKIRDKQKEMEEFKRSHPDGTVAPYQDDLARLQESLKTKERDVRDMNHDTLEDAVRAWQRLWSARVALRTAFEDAVKELKKARSSPSNYVGRDASSEDLVKFNRYIDVIESEIEIGARNHLTEEVNARGMIEKCSDLLAKSKL